MAGMSQPSRLYCRVVGCLTPGSIDVVVIGSPGVQPGSFYPHPIRRVPRDKIPPERRFPNSLVWFDACGDELIYVETNPDSDFQISD